MQTKSPEPGLSQDQDHLFNLRIQLYPLRWSITSRTQCMWGQAMQCLCFLRARLGAKDRSVWLDNGCGLREDRQPRSQDGSHTHGLYNPSFHMYCTKRVHSEERGSYIRTLHTTASHHLQEGMCLLLKCCNVFDFHFYNSHKWMNVQTIASNW